MTIEENSLIAAKNVVKMKNVIAFLTARLDRDVIAHSEWPINLTTVLVERSVRDFEDLVHCFFGDTETMRVEWELLARYCSTIAAEAILMHEKEHPEPPANADDLISMLQNVAFGDDDAVSLYVKSLINSRRGPSVN